MCIVSGCSYLSFTLLQKATTEQLQHALTKLGLALERGCTLPAPLCKGHYHAVYNVIYPTQSHCATCGVSLSHTNPKLCPDPTTIQQHLAEKDGFQGTLTATSKVCYSCYRAHLFVLKDDRGNASLDQDLGDTINSIEAIVQQALPKLPLTCLKWQCRR